MGVPMDWLANPAQQQPNISQGIDLSQPQAASAPTPAPAAPQSAMPRDANGTPLSPDMGGFQPALNPTTPDNAQAPTAPKPQQYGLLKRLLTTFVYNGAQAMKVNAGLPTDMELQKHQVQMDQMRAATAQAQQTTQSAIAGMQPVDLPQDAADFYGIKQVKAADLPHYMQNYAMFKGKEYAADTSIEKAKMQFGVGMPLDPRLAAMSGHPDWANKVMNKPQLDLLTKQVGALGYTIKDFGNEGQWLTNKSGEKVARVGNSASMDKANMMGPRMVTAMVNGVPTLVPTSQAAGLPAANMDPGAAARKAGAVAFTTGTEGDQIQSYRTFMGHLNDVYDASQQFKNTGSPYANKSINWLRANAAGDPAVSAYLAKIAPVTKEYESFLLNNRALYAEDRVEAQKILDENKTPDQIAAVSKSMAHTGAVRLGALNLRYRDTFGMDNETMIDPETGNLIKKFGQDATLDKYRQGGNIPPQIKKAKAAADGRAKDPLGIRP